MQVGAPGIDYGFPAPGVVTSWSYQASATQVPQIKLKVARDLGADNFLLVGMSDLKTPTPEKTATFAFSGTDARALAGFECSLDGGAFAACTSPSTVTVKKGNHAFSVRATDAVGNADGSPATDTWKVKKKKKR